MVLTLVSSEGLPTITAIEDKVLPRPIESRNQLLLGYQGRLTGKDTAFHFPILFLLDHEFDTKDLLHHISFAPRADERLT